MTTETPQGQITMVDPFDPAFIRMGDLVKPVGANSTRPTKEKPQPSYDALAIPENTEQRRALNNRLLELFMASCRKEDLKPEQLAIIKASLERAMPDPEQYPEEFVKFVQDKCHGSFEMLRQMVVLQGNPMKPKAGNGFCFKPEERTASTIQPAIIVEQASRLGISAVVSGMPTSLNQLPPELRNKIMCTRVAVLKDLTSSLPFRAANSEVYPVIAQRYTEARLAQVFDAAISAYTGAMEKLEQGGKFADPNRIGAIWFNNLLSRLYAASKNPRGAQNLLQKLAATMESAETPEVVAAAINSFGQTSN